MKFLELPYLLVSNMIGEKQELLVAQQLRVNLLNVRNFLRVSLFFMAQGHTFILHGRP